MKRMYVATNKTTAKIIVHCFVFRLSGTNVRDYSSTFGRCFGKLYSVYVNAISCKVLFSNFVHVFIRSRQDSFLRLDDFWYGIDDVHDEFHGFSKGYCPLEAWISRSMSKVTGMYAEIFFFYIFF